MKALLSLIFAACLALLAAAQEPTLTPLDLGFGLLDHGMVDFCNPPPNTKAGHFNSDEYLDIARFDGRKLEVYLMISGGYPTGPQLVKEFDKPIAALGFGGTVWDTHPPLKLTFEDGSIELFSALFESKKSTSSEIDEFRNSDEFEFVKVWEGESYPYGFDECAVGDLDNDGIIEYVTYWKEEHYANHAYMLIYKCFGDNDYELFMEEEFFIDVPYSPTISYLTIADLDQNGQQELIYTYDKIYFWEFSEPGV
ncbi:hypothetical protein KKA00_07485, partial [bacterium]|nr:hypothetical protein [bacterium]